MHFVKIIEIGLEYAGRKMEDPGINGILVWSTDK